MLRRRRTIRIACCALVVGVGLAGWLGSRGGRAEVKLIFRGFTNDASFWANSGQLPSPAYGSYMACLLILSNAGSVPLRFQGPDADDDIRLGCSALLYVEGEADSSASEIEEAIKPGKTFRLAFPVAENTNVYRRRFAFSRPSLRDRVAAACGRLGWTSVAADLSYDPNSNSLLWVSTGWITNPPAAR
jgi:hypothetical protein